MSRWSRSVVLVAAGVLGTSVAAAPPASPPAFPPATPESQGIDPAALRALADAVQGYVDGSHALGGELLVIQNRRTVLHEAFGTRDRERGLPMERDTIFNIRSMTKPLTGAAVQLLAERGALRLDDHAADYLEGFRNERSRVITIEQLLTHRSGLPLTILTTGVGEYPDLVAMADAVGEAGPEYEPGSRFWYSDSGTDVLGAIVEVVSGERLDAFVERELLRPLGMRDTFYLVEGWSADDPRAARVASLYVGGAGAWARFWGVADDPFYPYAWGSQTLYGTPRDYARFLAMWMDGGRVAVEGGADGGTLLSRETIDRGLAPVSVMLGLGSNEPMPTLFPGLEVRYGQMAMLYVETDTPAATRPMVIGHGGSDGTMGWAWPQRDLMVLYFTQSRGGLSVLRLEAEIDRHLIHPDATRTATPVGAEHEPFVGPYVANFGPYRDVEFTVLVQNGHLAVDIPGQLVFELHEPDAEGRRVFRMTDQVAVSFARDEAGAVHAMQIHQEGMTFELPKGRAKPRPVVELDPATLTRYLGTYHDEQAARDVHVVVHEGRLAVEVPGQPMPYALYPPDESGLWAMRLNVSVRLRFDEDADGRILSYTVVLPDGTELVRPRVQEPDEATPADQP